MRMKNRFCKMAKDMLIVMCFVSFCGAFNSCKDEYTLDDERPVFLGDGSIYAELCARPKSASDPHSFKTMIQLIDDLGEKEVLDKTGSKTLFAADDNAFAEFFRTTNWLDAQGSPVRSYEQLTESQKRLLLYNSMLDNAYVMEMLTNVTLNSTLSKNQCLRQGTSASATDSIPYWLLSANELPVNLNLSVDGFKSDSVWWNNNDFWANRRENASLGVYMAVDGTDPMLTHFLEGQMKEKSITHDDVLFVLNDKNPWPEDGEKRDYIYNRKVVEADVTCTNGYIHVLDGVLLTPPNMAEAIRQNPNTQLFSAMLDRFSYPYYDATLTRNYASMHNIGTDSVFTKLYVSKNGRLGETATMPDNTALDATFPKLNFDPAWNQYAVGNSVTKEQDMAVMFVPSDESLYNFFVKGSGRVIMERFAKVPVEQLTKDNLKENLFQIPLEIIKSMINNLMKPSFCESVPSKYKTIMNDAQDQMFPPAQYPSLNDFKALFDTVMLANNGVVYVLKDRMIAPADYASVIAPAIYNSNTQIIKALVQADEPTIKLADGYSRAPLQKYYSTYLKAMQSRFSFFIPTDEALKTYGLVDPYAYSFGDAKTNKARWRYWTFEFNNNRIPSGKYIPVDAQAKVWTMEQERNSVNDKNAAGIQLVRGNVSGNTTDDQSWGEVRKTLLTEMVDHHIIVHDASQKDGLASDANWYLSRNGAPVYVKNKVSSVVGSTKVIDAGTSIEGGLQVMLNGDDITENDEECNILRVYDQSGLNRETGAESYGNGMTYIIDRPMQATLNPVYKILKANTDYSMFFDACNGVDVDLLKSAGFDYVEETVNGQTVLVDSTMSTADWNKDREKFYIFRTGNTNNFFTPAGESLVRFFNNYHYTIYAPTNTAMQAAYDAGLPTWADITKFVNDSIVNEMEFQTIPTKEEVADFPDKKAEREATVNKKLARVAKARAMVTMLLNFLKYHFQDHSIFADNITLNADVKTGGTGETYQTSCIYNGAYITLTPIQQGGNFEVKDACGNFVTVQQPWNQLANDMEFTVNTSGNSSSLKGHVKVNSYAVIHTVNNYLNFLTSGDWTGSNKRFDGAWASPKKAMNFVKKYRIRK